MRRLLPIVLACWLPLLPGCGKEDEPAPRIFDVRAPEGSAQADFPEVGMSFAHPRNWTLRPREAPGVFELVSGEALVAGWAYPREEPLPETDAQLEAAKDRLLDAIDERDPAYRVRSATSTEVAGARAIEVRGQQVLSGRTLRTTSVHVFDGQTEYVIEALAPPRDHRLVDTRVLAPLLRSLTVDGEADVPDEG